MLLSDPMNAKQHVYVLRFENAWQAQNKERIYASLCAASPPIPYDAQLYGWLAAEIAAYANLA